MRTQCPHCSTSFRITPEQLRVKAGKVRCGECKAVFDAFDSLIEESTVNTPPVPAQTEILPPLSVEILPSADATAPISVNEEALTPISSMATAEGATTSPESAEALQPDHSIEEIVASDTPTNETPEETAAAARDAGLMAARELNETAAYNRWSAGTLVLDSHGRIVDGTASGRILWPFISVASILGIVLVLQIAQFFRTELVQSIPDLRGFFTAIGSDIPLPQQADLVRIEVSDLQSDPKRALLVLEATLKNHAAYAQAWPSLELTLTDADDAVVTRRVLSPADYLPPKADTRAFGGNQEIGLRLWIESKSPAAGYRLYVFYP